jgi:hypothetical protein
MRKNAFWGGVLPGCKFSPIFYSLKNGGDARGGAFGRCSGGKHFTPALPKMLKGAFWRGSFSIPPQKFCILKFGGGNTRGWAEPEGV